MAARAYSLRLRVQKPMSIINVMDMNHRVNRTKKS
jgi:hypothetical protein